MQYVWKEFISKSPAKFKAVVAHSYGGFLTVKLAEQFTEFRKEIKAIAMTDSVHQIEKRLIDVEKFLLSVSKIPEKSYNY